MTTTFAGVTTPRDAFLTNAPTMFSLSKKEGSSKKHVIALLKLQLISLDAFLKQKDGLTQEEIDFIAEAIFQEHGMYLNFADINVVFRNAKMGKYGELYGQLSCPKIMQWFIKYDQEKTAEIERYRIEEKEAYQKTQSTLTNEDMHRIFGVKIDGDGKIMFNQDGKMQFDQDIVAKREAKAAEEKQRKAEEEAKRRKGDAEFMRIKYKAMYDGIMNKPAEIRTHAEINFVKQYEEANKKK